jgi:hypothetical protein
MHPAKDRELSTQCWLIFRQRVIRTKTRKSAFCADQSVIVRPPEVMTGVTDRATAPDRKITRKVKPMVGMS